MIMKYVQLAALGGVIAGAVALKLLWGMNQDLKASNLILKTQIETNEVNLLLLTGLLHSEETNRQAAESALLELTKEVPHAIYRKELPPSIQKVLDNFHNDIRNSSN